MALYSGPVTSRYVDPRYDGASRTEFRIESEGKLLLSNWRLCNVGFTAPGSDRVGNSLTGCHGVIRSLTLYDKDTELEAVHDFNQLFAFRNYAQSNDQSRDRNRALYNGGLGFIPHTSQTRDGFLLTQASPQYLDMTGDVSTTPKGWLDLRQIFGVLSAARMLPNFRALRLVVEWDTQQYRAFPAARSAAAHTEPVLIIDEVVDPALVQKHTKTTPNVQFTSWEHDQLVLPALTPTAGDPSPQQTYEGKVRGMEHRSIGRMLLVNQPTQTNSALFGRLGSAAQRASVVQLRVNGRDVLPFQGADRSMRRLALLTDTFGPCGGALPGANDPGMSDAPNRVDDSTEIVGQLDYFAVAVADRVEDCALRFQRTGAYNAAATDQTKEPWNQQLLLDAHYECLKTLSRRADGSSHVTYD